MNPFDSAAPFAAEAAASHAARVGQLMEFLRQNEARLLARKSELEAELRQAGLETPEAIQVAFDRIDPVECVALDRDAIALLTPR